MQQFITGGLMAVGAAGFCIWGFAEAYQATKLTPQKESINWIKVGMTVVPSLVGGFLAGYYLTPTSVLDYASIVTSGFGAAAAGKKLGINSFFDQEDHTQ